VILFHSFDLPWSAIQEEFERLKRLVVVCLGVAVIVGIVIPFIPVPKKDLSKEEKLPPRLAQLVLEHKEKPKPPPPPPPKKEEKKEEKKKEEKKPEKKKVEKKKEEPKKKVEKKVEPKPKPEKTEAQKIAEARRKAQQTGLLAFADELADLRDKKVDAALNKSAKLTKGGAATKEFKRNILTSNATVPAGSGGIDTSRLSKGVSSGTQLAGRETSKVDDVIAEAAAAAQSKVTESGNKSKRTPEEVSIVFDRNKGAFYALYNRALRKDPTIAGKIVFEITISPDGAVIDVKVVSSELNNAALEHKLLIKIKSFSFEPKSGAENLIVTYPLDFVPS